MQRTGAAMKEDTPYQNGGMGARTVYGHLWWTPLTNSPNSGKGNRLYPSRMNQMNMNER